MIKTFLDLKKLSILVALIALASCQSKIKTEGLETEQATIIEEDVQPYETVASEEQAIAMDEQAQEEAEEVEVVDRVLFGYDSAKITAEAAKILDTQAAWLKSDVSINVTVEGHCDERGTREYNIALGEKRANSAKNYLIDQGIHEDRIKIISYGKERPAFFGVSEDSLAKNRRAVTVVN